ncbi:MAG: VOC family protein [Candidatus Parcubacteria bacterium]|nr:VOC family protein [Burkholderiales bacterium]
MYDHIGLKVKDIQAGVRFYTAVLAPLGHVPGASGDSYAGFGPKDAAALWLHAYDGKTGPGAHVCFSATGRAAVDAFHAAGLKAGGKDNGKPGPRPDYGPKYYAAFLIDPDGNNVEAVCFD